VDCDECKILLKEKFFNCLKLINLERLATRKIPDIDTLQDKRGISVFNCPRSLRISITILLIITSA